MQKQHIIRGNKKVQNNFARDLVEEQVQLHFNAQEGEGTLC